MKKKRKDMSYSCKKQENKSNKILIRFPIKNQRQIMIKMKTKIRKNKKKFLTIRLVNKHRTMKKMIKQYLL